MGTKKATEENYEPRECSMVIKMAEAFVLSVGDFLSTSADLRIGIVVGGGWGGGGGGGGHS